MTTQAPNPRELKSWEDAFQYPIPTVRGMEKRMRQNINENHEKLRSLVGSSYRDLLGTAQTIIETNGEMQEVENLLAKTSRQSDSRIFERFGVQQSRLAESWKVRDSARLGVAAQRSALTGCITAIDRALRVSHSRLLASKIYLIARLLHKSLASTPSSTSSKQSALNRLSQKLNASRQKLLRSIDRHLVQPTADVSVIVEDLSAFCLATSSSPTDALTHFLSLRSEAITRAKQQSDDTPIGNGITSRLDLFTQTLRTSKRIFPDLLSGSLKTLNAKPILQDDSITGLEDLELDVHQRWLGNDLRNFTPWTRHDELSRSKAEDGIKRWASSTLVTTIKAISNDISTETDFHALATTRRDVLQMWLSSRRLAHGLNVSDAMNQLRHAFGKRQRAMIEDQSRLLRSAVCSNIIDPVEAWRQDEADASAHDPWDPALLDMAYQNGAVAFRKTIVNSRYGRSSRIQTLLNAFHHNSKPIEIFQTTITGMQRMRWDDDLDDDENDDHDNHDDTTDENSSKSARQTLSIEDPQSLHTHLRQVTLQVVTDIENTLSSAIGSKQLKCNSAKDPGVFVLRSIRELKRLLPPLIRSLSSQSQKTSEDLKICADLTTSLQNSLTSSIITQCQASLSRSLKRFSTSKLHMKALWDAGSPSLPIQPSPGISKHLRDVVRAMEEVGADLWSPHAVDGLKIEFGKLMDSEVGMAADAIQASEVEDDDKKDKLTQLLCDSLYLAQALKLSGAQATEAVRKRVEALHKQAGIEDDEETRARLERGAIEYWRRTCLMFGLLLGS